MSGERTAYTCPEDPEAGYDPPVSGPGDADLAREVLSEPSRIAALRATGLLDQPPLAALDRLTRLASRLLGAPVSLLSFVDDQRQFFVSEHGLQDPWATRRQTPLTHSFCQHVVASDAPLVVEDARKESLLVDNLAIPDLGVIAYAGVPVRTGTGEVLGSFCVIDDQPHSWAEADIDILRDLAEVVVTELTLREHATRADTLLASVPMITYDLEPVNLRVVNIAGQVESMLGVAASEVLADPEVLDALIDPDDRAAVEATRRRAVDQGEATIAYRLRSPSGSWLWVQESVRFAGVDLPSDGGSVTGVIIDVTPQHQLAQRLDAQNRVSMALASAPDVSSGLEGLLLHLGESLGWELGHVWLPDASQQLLVLRAEWSRPGVDASTFIAATRARTFGAGEGLPGTAWVKGEPLWSRDVLAEDNFPRKAEAVLDGLHGALVFPIIRRGESAGVVELFTEEMREPDTGLLEVVRAIGSQIGQFLDRLETADSLRESRAYYRRMARTFQRSLVPSEPPAIEGFDLATRFHPANADEIVGGDFLDAFRLPSGSWALTIGDVCGKGTTAAAITTLVRHSLRGAALGGSGPVRALEVANTAVLAEELGERFCSAVLVALSPPGGDGRSAVSVANAGHPAMLVVRTDGTIERCRHHGLVLGAFDTVGAVEEWFTLAPGDALVLYTDGYSEARGNDDFYGEERLEAVLQANAGRTADELASALDAAVSAFAGDSRRDDQALIVIQPR